MTKKKIKSPTVDDSLHYSAQIAHTLDCYVVTVDNDRKYFRHNIPDVSRLLLTLTKAKTISIVFDSVPISLL